MRRAHTALLSLCAALTLGSAAAPALGAPSLCRAVGPDEVPGLGGPVQGPFAPALDPLQDLRTDMDLAGLPAGGDGAGVRVADVEYDWDAQNAELDTRALGTPSSTAPYANAISHGTAALSVVGGRADGHGITGIAPAAELIPVTSMQGGAWNPGAGIDAAAARLRAGDVLLVEQQGQVGNWLVPVYADAGARAAMVRAAGRGIVVVIPAGNGDRVTSTGGDLGAATFTAPGDVIVVGAGQSSHAGGVTGARAAFSNFGPDVDVQGPGMGVVAAHAWPTLYTPLVGTEADDPHRSYTACFNGTSSAAAVMAGGIASMQGIARAARGTPFTPAEVEARLRATGTPQVQPSTGSIGPTARFRAAADLVPPGAPTGLGSDAASVAPGAPITLRWVSPADAPDGSGRGDDVVSVAGRVLRIPAGVGTVTVPAPGASPAELLFTVRAEDRAGNFSEATQGLATPVPGTPASPTTGVQPPPASGTSGGGTTAPPSAGPLAQDPAPVPAADPTPVAPLPNPTAPPVGPSRAVTPQVARVAAVLPVAGRVRAVSRPVRGLVTVLVALAPRGRAVVRGRGARVVGSRVLITAAPARTVTLTLRAPSARPVTLRVTVSRAGRVTVRPTGR